MNVSEILRADAEQINAELERLLTEYDSDYPSLTEAMRYSASGGGKRVRPCIVLEVCRMLSGDVTKALPLAAALEMVHTYSLIHDDLPCMDNDDLRRGKPTNHKVFGEATAVLAGDALLTMAFELISESPELTAEAKVDAVRVMSNAAGRNGMIGGQMLDLIGESRQLDRDTHRKMNLLKTGALIRAAVSLGCIAAGVDGVIREKLDMYGKCVGIAFQVSDDLLDEGEEDEKTTYLTFLTREEARKYVFELTEKAVNSVSGFDGSEVLIGFARSLAGRKF